MRENGFVINHPLHMCVLPLVSCCLPWSPVVSCGVLCSVRCRCLPSCPLMCCPLSLCCRVVLCLCLCSVFALGVLYAIGLCLVARLSTDWFVHCFCLFVHSFVRLFVFCLFVSLVDVSLLFLWSGIVGSWLVSFARCFWSICWLVQVRKNMLYESPPR